MARYRRWYALLLRLYPRPFRERFAEQMAQTFADLCRERGEANHGLHAFALATFAETATQIMRENMRQLVQTRIVIRWVLITAAVLAVPALAMVFFNRAVPNSDIGSVDVNWGPMDFAIIGGPDGLSRDYRRRSHHQSANQTTAAVNDPAPTAGHPPHGTVHQPNIP